MRSSVDQLFRNGLPSHRDLASCQEEPSVIVPRTVNWWIECRTGWPGIRASTYVCTLGTGAKPALLILAL